jgi:hypothetical protein
VSEDTHTEEHGPTDIATTLAKIDDRLRDIEQRQSRRAGAEAVIVALTTMLLLAVIAGAWQMGNTVTRNDVEMDAHVASAGHPPTVAELRRVELAAARLRSSHESEVERTREAIERIESALSELTEDVSVLARRRR